MQRHRKGKESAQDCEWLPYLSCWASEADTDHVAKQPPQKTGAGKLRTNGRHIEPWRHRVRQSLLSDNFSVSGANIQLRQAIIFRLAPLFPAR